MTLLILLIVVGLVLLGFEVIIPGGLLGVLGAMALIAGCVVAFVQHGAGTGGDHDGDHAGGGRRSLDF